MSSTHPEPVLFSPAQPRDILNFAVKWLPYGGGSDEEIFIRFGIGPDEYFSRIISAMKANNCDAANIQTVIALAHTRRRLPPEPTLM